MAESGSSPAGASRRTYRGCSNILEYELRRKLGEGTFGEVYQGIRRRTGDVVALKKILMHQEKDGFPITALREIKLLKILSHENVIRLEEMAIERHPSDVKKRAIHYMVTPYMEHDLSGLLDNPDIRITEPQIKCYMQQIFKGLLYLHNCRILHRDMKAANLLVNNRGILKIADFGLARQYYEDPPTAGKPVGEAKRDYTSLVVTRWYRPPELFLGLRRYTPAIDLWGAGCVFGEMFKRKPILPGTSDTHQTLMIFELMGGPNDANMPGWDVLPGAKTAKPVEKAVGSIDKTFSEMSPEGLSLLKELLKLNWKTRINAVDALQHPYFKTRPLPARPEDIPSFRDSHELDRRNNRPSKPKPPPAPEGPDVSIISNGDMRHKGNGVWPLERQAGGVGRDYPKRLHEGAFDRSHGQRPSHEYHGSRMPAAPEQSQPRRSGWQVHANGRQDGDQHQQNGTRSTLPPPPGEGARHPLPPAPHRFNGKDTYIPSYSGSGGRRDESHQSRGHSHEDDAGRYEAHPSGPRDSMFDRDDSYRRDHRRPRNEYRDRDRDEGLHPSDRRDERSGFARRTRSRSPEGRSGWGAGHGRDRDRERDR